MKKYLFLFLLFLIYIVIIFNKDEQVVSVFKNEERYGVNTYLLKFDNGINSKQLINIFNNYKKDVIITNINELEVYSDNIKDSINQVYEKKDNIFEIYKLASGFKVESVVLKADVIIEKFLKDNNINYLYY